MATSSSLRIVHHPELDLGLPPAPPKFVCPASHKEHTTLRTSKGVERKRMIHMQDACTIMGGMHATHMRRLLRSGLIYCFKASERSDSWFKIDSVGVYLYRENQRRRALGHPPTQQWLDYSAWMTRLNSANPDVMGPPPIPQ